MCAKVHPDSSARSNPENRGAPVLSIIDAPPDHLEFRQAENGLTLDKVDDIFPDIEYFLKVNTQLFENITLDFDEL